MSPRVQPATAGRTRELDRVCSRHVEFFRKPFDLPAFPRSIARLAAGTGRDHLRVVK